MRYSIRWTLLPRVAPFLLALFVAFCELRSQPAGGILVLFMGWYGAYRALKFHPVVHSKYRQWLELSPWTNRLPLPLGPVMFGWQDALLIAAVSALASLRYGVAPLMPFTAFATIYAVFACLPLLMLKRGAECIAIVVLLPLMILFGHRGNMRFDVAGVCFMIAQIGMWQTLAKFPWPRETPKPPTDWLGFPVNKLGPIASVHRIEPGVGTGFALIIGWWIAAITLTVPEMSAPGMVNSIRGVCIIAAGLMALIRFGLYCGTYGSPITLWGRIWTGRWLIPNYDYVLIAPLIVACSGVVLPQIGLWLGLSNPLILATS